MARPTDWEATAIEKVVCCTHRSQGRIFFPAARGYYAWKHRGQAEAARKNVARSLYRPVWVLGKWSRNG